MLRDEAIEALLARVEDSVDGVLRVRADHGEYTASYDDEGRYVAGERHPVMSDALVSLVRRLDA